MKYFIDTEFLEGPQKERFPVSLFRKHTSPTIDLISIGIVAEDGREYYAISKDFNLEEAWNRYDFKETSPGKKYIGIYEEKVYWIRKNVLYPIFIDLTTNHDLDGMSFSYDNFERLVMRYGKSNKQIAEEVREFCTVNETRGRGIIDRISPSIPDINRTIEFYAYYADYDWVVFCWLFGKMMDLPEGFPMYCKDLKQDFDFYNGNFIKRKAMNAVGNIDKSINSLKDFKDYPTQDNAHDALDDARWNKKLYEFLNKL